jgi:uncharacterized protein (TIGR03000 family)
VLSARLAPGQPSRKTVILEVLLPDSARLFIEGEETKVTGSMRKFESPPLPPGNYTYTIKAIIPGPKGPQTITRRIDVRPGDFESIDLRPRRDGDHEFPIALLRDVVPYPPGARTGEQSKLAAIALCRFIGPPF